MLPMDKNITCSIQENHKNLAEIEFYSDKRVTIPSTCHQLTNFQDVYPYSEFPTYVPKGTITVGCNTVIGLIEIQFICHSTDSCW